ncbi:hypothetical protein [Mycolicibacterium wolinskyi]|uniref:hypothetical protein n=1 Tax=Mycolicibacterium wolinskyi TaxID=59750 RepID=UPI003BA8B316
MAISEPVTFLASVGHVVLAAAETTSTSGMDTSKGWWETYGGPAVIAALITVVLGSVIQYLFTMRKERTTALRDLRVKALNEFYAPIKTLLGGNLVLRDALFDELGVVAGEEWHMLDHLDEIRGNAMAREIVEEVLGINKKIGEILESKSGLDLGQSAFKAQWEVHRRLLDRAFSGAPGQIKGKLTYFPKSFEDDINRMHDELLRAVKSGVGMKTE